MPDDKNRPRVHWCPTGPFAFLPIHAAGSYIEAPFQCASDYVVSSYTPTVTALLNAQRDPPTRGVYDPDSCVLLAAVPQAPGYLPLPHTSTEAALLRDLIPSTRTLEGARGAMTKAWHCYVIRELQQARALWLRRQLTTASLAICRNPITSFHFRATEYSAFSTRAFVTFF